MASIRRTPRDQRLWERLLRKIDSLGRLTWAQKRAYWRLKEMGPYRAAPTRARQIRDAADPRVGESEEEARERVKDMFRPPLDIDAQYRDMDEEEWEYYSVFYTIDLS